MSEVLHLRSSAGLYGAEYVILGMVPELNRIGIRSRLLSMDNQHLDSQPLYARAQAMGVPAVSTFHSGIPEGVIDGVTGTLVPERDSEKLAAAILQLLEDRELWERYHLATQPHIDKNFDLQRQTALLEEIYSNALAGRALASPALRSA